MSCVIAERSDCQRVRLPSGQNAKWPDHQAARLLIGLNSEWLDCRAVPSGSIGERPSSQSGQIAEGIVD